MSIEDCYSSYWFTVTEIMIIEYTVFTVSYAFRNFIPNDNTL